MNCSTPGLPVHHQLPEFIQTHVHRVSDAIQPSHPTQDLYKCQIIFLESFPSKFLNLIINISIQENLSSAHYVLTFVPRFLTLLFFFLINESLKLYYELYVWLVSKCFFIHLDYKVHFLQTNGFLKKCKALRGRQRRIK